MRCATPGAVLPRNPGETLPRGEGRTVLPRRAEAQAVSGSTGAVGVLDALRRGGDPPALLDAGALDDPGDQVTVALGRRARPGLIRPLAGRMCRRWIDVRLEDVRGGCRDAGGQRSWTALAAAAA
jgi:hypothetical protein